MSVRGPGRRGAGPSGQRADPVGEWGAGGQWLHCAGLAGVPKGKQIGRRIGQRVKADRVGPQVLELQAQGWTYRQIARRLNISKNTVTDIVKRHRQTEPQDEGAF